MKQHNVVLALFLSLLALPLSAGAAAHKTAPLKVGGIMGWKVKTVQIKLNAIGMKTPTTGKYTKDLETQVRAFQRSHRLPSTGKVDDTPISGSRRLLLKRRASMGSGGRTWSIRPPGTRGCPTASAVPHPGPSTVPDMCSMYSVSIRQRCPRTADLQYEKGLFVTQRQLKPGIWCSSPTYEPGASHVGIYAGDGLFWNATSSAGVRLCSLSDEYWRTRYYGAKRVLVPAHKGYK